MSEVPLYILACFLGKRRLVEMIRWDEAQVLKVSFSTGVWVVRVGGDNGELQPWHCISVYSIEIRLIHIYISV